MNKLTVEFYIYLTRSGAWRKCKKEIREQSVQISRKICQNVSEYKFFSCNSLVVWKKLVTQMRNVSLKRLQQLHLISRRKLKQAVHL